VDTAPDMIGALLRLRDELGLPDRLMSHLRTQVSRGAVALLDVGLPELGPSARPTLRERYLALYAEAIAVHSRTFPGIKQILAHCAELGMPWGVVTNKPITLTQSLLHALQLIPGVVIGGDSFPERKPHPRPVLEACSALGVSPAQAWMIGDDPRDIEAGRAAGCQTIACAYGYVEQRESLLQWGADFCIQSADELLPLLAAQSRSVGAMRTSLSALA